MTTVFVTGATGVVGSAVTERLLAVPDVHLRLLVRAESADALAAKTAALREWWRASPARGAAFDDAAVTRRVEFLVGDASRPGLGLGPATREALAASCTHFVHCAGEVKMNLPIEAARRSATVALEGVLELARAAQAGGRLAKIDVVSTVGVAGRRPGVLPERWIHGTRGFHNTYEQAKAEAEALLERAAGRLPVTVHRPSMVVGDSDSGRVMRFQVFYHLAEFLSGLRTRGLFPPLGGAVLDLVPVDHVADAIVWSILHPEASTGRILHLSAGPGGVVPLDALRDRVRRAFARSGIATPTPRTLPAPVFRAALRAVALVAGARDRRALATLPVFLDYLASDQRFANVATTGLLAAHGIPTPQMPRALDAVLDRYLAARRR